MQKPESQGEIKVGSVVRLASGGPIMTVEGISVYDLSNKRMATCVWFDKNNETDNYTVDVRCLVICNPGVSPMSEAETYGRTIYI